MNIGMGSWMRSVALLFTFSNQGTMVASGNRVPSRRLDFLRGIAAVYVVIGHARGNLFAGGQALSKLAPLSWFDYLQLAMLQFTGLGTEAVIVFFVLSGFAMAHSISVSKSILKFYLRRIVRIWPPYLLAVAIAFVIAAFITQYPSTKGVGHAVALTSWGWRDLLGMMLYLRVDSGLTAQFWSLPQEVIFYIMCPFILASARRVYMMGLLSLLLFIISIVTFGIYDGASNAGGLKYFSSLMIYFMTGAVAYHSQDIVPASTHRHLFFLAALYAGLIFIVKYYVVVRGWNQVTNIMAVPLALVLLFYVPARVYEFKYTNWGKFSYSIYIYHFQIIAGISFLLTRFFKLGQSDMTSYWLWTLSVPPVLGICWILYLISEKPCNSLLLQWREASQRQNTTTL